MAGLIFQRVLQERSELAHKLGKLKAFIGTAPFVALSSEQQTLLILQADVMDLYNTILNRRCLLMEKSE
jgi:hypothetical protein